MVARSLLHKDRGVPNIKPSTIEAILTGKVKIVPVDGGSYYQEKEIGGYRWYGTSYQYDIDGLPKGVNGESGTWNTQLIVWTPNPLVYSDLRGRPPGMQIYIATGGGEMVLTDNEEHKVAVFQEISRQLEESADK